MSYLVLARKYRPRTFAEVAGQEVLTKTLQGAIREGRVGHAYLFTGPRGTGKTTSARVFAKALNCEKGPTIDPCGVCERCAAVDSGSDVDVVEIDAASNTGVENIRDLREQAAYTPMRARFKIFIVDEVHMLSKGAFNALLKTLEEPPAHVKFLFATTELNKVPDTILSRCQVLRLSLFSEELIAKRLTQIFEFENVRAASGVALGLARLAHGSMRDALSITDQLLALVGQEPRRCTSTESGMLRSSRHSSSRHSSSTVRARLGTSSMRSRAANNSSIQSCNRSGPSVAPMRAKRSRSPAKSAVSAESSLQIASSSAPRNSRSKLPTHSLSSPSEGPRISRARAPSWASNASSKLSTSPAALAPAKRATSARLGS